MNLKKILTGKSKLYRILVVSYLLFLLIVILFSVNIFKNIHSFTNSSHSMSPVINTGSLTIVKKADSYEIGDIITYYTTSSWGEQEIITHRIMDIGGNVYTTKGDANQVYDRQIVQPRLIIGKVEMIIPHLGHLISFAKSKLGSIVLIILPAALIIAIEILKIFHFSRKRFF